VFAFLAFLPRRSFWPSGACVAMPFIIGLPASVHRGESSDKGQWMLPLIGGPSATPFCLYPLHGQPTRFAARLAVSSGNLLQPAMTLHVSATRSSPEINGTKNAKFRPLGAFSGWSTQSAG
jgi:hypothetical protein